MLEPTFGGINLEDIKAPECFEIEEELRRTLAVYSFSATFEHHPFRVTHYDVLTPNSESDVMLGTSNRSRIRTVEDHPHLIDFLPGEF